MTGKQNAVMWMGLMLVLLRLFTTGQWSAIWSKTILNGGKTYDTPKDKSGKDVKPGYKLDKNGNQVPLGPGEQVIPPDQLPNIIQNSYQT
jgi:hypothetical protein